MKIPQDPASPLHYLSSIDGVPGRSLVRAGWEQAVRDPASARWKVRWASLAAALLLGSFASGQTPGTANQNEYQGIEARNVFGLNPPPPPSASTTGQPARANIKLTGIVAFSGKKWACLVVVPGDPMNPVHAFHLLEGQREGNIEVVRIFEKDGEVKIRDQGKEGTLSFRNNGLDPLDLPKPPPPFSRALGPPGVATPPRINAYRTYATRTEEPPAVDLPNNE